jgi:hypothetical protein
VRLAAIDLDGTLVRSDGTVSERSRAAIRRASSSGNEIVLITARGPRSVGELAADLGVRGEAICSNGAIVLDLATREVIRMRTIETEVALGLVHALRERLPGIVFAVEWERLAHEPGFEADWPLPPDTPISDAIALLEKPPAKLILQPYAGLGLNGSQRSSSSPVRRTIRGKDGKVRRSLGFAPVRSLVWIASQTPCLSERSRTVALICRGFESLHPLLRTR